MTDNLFGPLSNKELLPNSLPSAFYIFFEKYKKFEEKGKIYIFNVLQDVVDSEDFLRKWHFFAGGVLRSNMEYINIKADKISIKSDEIQFKSQSKDYLNLYTFKQLLALAKSYDKAKPYTSEVENPLFSSIEVKKYLYVALIEIIDQIVTLRNMLAHDVNPNVSSVKLEDPPILDSVLESINVEILNSKELYTKLTIACFWMDYITGFYFNSKKI